MNARRQRHSQAVELLTDIGREVRTGVNLLSQLLGMPAADRRPLREELIGLEGTAMDLHFNLMTHIRSVFLTPLPREDIYALSQLLNRTLEHVVAAGDLIIARENLVLPRQSSDQLETMGRQVDLTIDALARLDDFDHLEEYWIQIQRLTKQANRTHREWLISSDSAFQPNIALQQAQIASAMLQAVESLRMVSTTAGSIIVRES
ncbi:MULTISPECIES: DUF47 domain-containing protein [unclassified Nesterenkonia]|uniref:DUF47 domain-containing protein n=1 Tax=unclassified Nesterenkonia TaxID=2629769 RepID=UPI0009F3C5C0|nr:MULTISPECIES: hypothetical protein [unclassified Nesterenkonia]MDS2173239.1 nuclease PIN [Nesterenkonia sp. CL21]OSM43619.1 hypothetical protein BCY76_007255 [Nesterenkonia sp. PF2B19]